MSVSEITWREPNRANTPPLHIASRGERFSTLTGVCWLDEHRFLVNHRSGLRMALFDLREGRSPVLVVPLPHLTDDIAAHRTADGVYEVAVSGCWEAACSRYRLELAEKTAITLLETREARDRTFCHGVAYDARGTLCLSFHTGVDPRIEIGEATSRLPAPWGARDLCCDPRSGRYFAVAVSRNPQRRAYGKTGTSLWSMLPGAADWRQVATIDGVHADACQVHRGRIWLPDQKGDRVLGICLEGERPPVVLRGPCFDFPHGLGISASGMLAVTNYGSSSIALVDLNRLAIREDPRQPPVA